MDKPDITKESHVDRASVSTTWCFMVNRLQKFTARQTGPSTCGMAGPHGRKLKMAWAWVLTGLSFSFLNSKGKSINRFTNSKLQARGSINLPFIYIPLTFCNTRGTFTPGSFFRSLSRRTVSGTPKIPLSSLENSGERKKESEKHYLIPKHQSVKIRRNQSS